MSTRTDKYIAPFCVAGVGLLCLASPLFLNLGSQMPSYIESQQLASRQETQRKELTERKKTSDRIKQTGLPIAGSTHTIIDYLDDPDKLPKLPKTVLNRYANTQAWVFDASDQCIGRIIKGQFISKHKSSTTCEDIPNGTRQ
ncbi:MAG: hypothetical protein HC903_28525 [Methylacidiphilales bacterium]|nr:hypothetical protein [Candidatus Methylacidiphilales bacterium]NJR17153.1 hypothetical protein [Calothrix sp. CSU_2_0]